MKSESRDKDVSDINEMVERDFKFYILDSSEEYISGMPRVVERLGVILTIKNIINNF